MKKFVLFCTTAMLPSAVFAQSTGTIETEKETIVITGTRAQKGTSGARSSAMNQLRPMPTGMQSPQSETWRQKLMREAYAAVLTSVPRTFGGRGLGDKLRHR